MKNVAGDPQNNRSFPVNSTALSSLLKLQENIIPVSAGGVNIDYYLYERYVTRAANWKLKVYYFVKPFVPSSLRLTLRRRYSHIQAKAKFPSWPIEPIIIEGIQNYLFHILFQSHTDELYRISPWPSGKIFAFAITHDVEWEKGLKNAPAIAELEKQLGFRSSWNIVPERYPIDWKIIDKLRADGFEIGVHGLKHDGKLFQSRRVFKRSADRINNYARQWGAAGFRSESTLRNVDWMPELKFEYDTSFPDTDPYEPQPGGCCSIWPYFIKDIVELPITLPQDHTLFEVLGLNDIAIWKKKAEWIEGNSGLILVDVHPDYMMSVERLRLYEKFLLYMNERKQMWHALPREIARWWKDREVSQLRSKNGSYFIEGPIAGRGTIIKTSLAKGELKHLTLNIQ